MENIDLKFSADCYNNYSAASNIISNPLNIKSNAIISDYFINKIETRKMKTYTFISCFKDYVNVF